MNLQGLCVVFVWTVFASIHIRPDSLWLRVCHCKFRNIQWRNSCTIAGELQWWGKV